MSHKGHDEYIEQQREMKEENPNSQKEAEMGIEVVTKFTVTDDEAGDVTIEKHENDDGQVWIRQDTDTLLVSVQQAHDLAACLQEVE